MKWDGGILPLPFSVWHPSISEVRLDVEEERNRAAVLNIAFLERLFDRESVKDTLYF